MEKKIWFITGISSGLGQVLANYARGNGAFVIGTFRNPEQVRAYSQEHGDQSLAVLLDITDGAQVESVVAAILARFGRIDVLVNNAGYGLSGAVEETSMEEARDIFEANFFGPLRLAQAFLPMFRKQGRGHILQVSSHGGVKAFPGFGLYNASKFALEGFSEALAAEVAPLGIRLTIVEPGPFRTNFAGDGFQQAAKVIPDYHATAGAFRERIKAVDGKQEGDPEKAAAAMYQITEMPEPPLRLPLGKVALASINSKLEQVRLDVERMREVAEGAVY